MLNTLLSQYLANLYGLPGTYISIAPLGEKNTL
jgi:hypothetical protein